MKHLDLDGASYASKWGITDFYEDVEALLREAVESGEDFDTGWFGCKKEIRYAMYTKNRYGFFITVSAHMDDLYEGADLIYDALYEEFDVIGVTDDLIDEIRELALEDGIDDVSYIDVRLPRDASYDDIIRATQEAEDEAEMKNKDKFDRLCKIVKDCVMNR